MKEEKYLSIITNFGCHYTCPYCIVKENNLHIPKTTLEGLKELVNVCVDNNITIISLSGGGDPLHNYNEHKGWFAQFFDYVELLNVKIELHTSYVEIKDFPYEKFDRVVYHLRNYLDFYSINRSGVKSVRAVFVVTEIYSKSIIDKIYETFSENENVDELTFRQMVDNKYNTTHYCESYLKSKHKKKWWYVEQDDYNLYYAENKVSTRYQDFQKNIINK